MIDPPEPSCWWISSTPFAFPTGLVCRARGAGRAADSRAKALLKSAGVPVIYANDHFGGWTRDFSELVRQCEAGTAGSEVARLLQPEPDDYSVLKPRHSVFYGTPLEFLRDELGIRRLVLTGIAADTCVLFTVKSRISDRVLNLLMAEE